MNEPFEPHEPDEAEQAKTARRVQREIDDLKWVMADPRGRRFVTRILGHAGVWRSTFHTSGSIMSHSEGKRDVGLWLVGELNEHAFKGYLQLLTEYRNNDD